VRDRVPRIVHVDGVPHWVFDGDDQGFASGYGTIKVDGTKASTTEFFEMSIDDVSPAAYDPEARAALLNDIGLPAMRRQSNQSAHRTRRVVGRVVEIIYQTCQSRCTADDFLNVVGNSTLEDRVGGIADMG
jgi:hypothetical protein